MEKQVRDNEVPNGGDGEATPAGTAGRVLIVDDDSRLRELTATFLERNGFSVWSAMDAAQTAEVLAAFPIDVVILDIMLPGEDGLSICRRLTSQPKRPGIIMVSAAGDEMDRIVGLEVGADDYVAKPCNPRELLARIRALLRRMGVDHGPSTAAAPALEFRFAGWVASLWTAELRAPDGTLVTLTGQEFALLRIFLERPRQALSRDEILRLLRGRQTHAFERIIDSHVSRLRRKLDAHTGHSAELIRTLRNEGYMFAANVTVR